MRQLIGNEYCRHGKSKTKCDSFVKLRVGKDKTKSQVVKNDLNPSWKGAKLDRQIENLDEEIIGMLQYNWSFNISDSF